MFRFLKRKAKINWKYIIGEILLIFFTITLAIWFNNWNESRKIATSKKIAMAKVIEEMDSNSKELAGAMVVFDNVYNAYMAFNRIYDGNTSEILARPRDLHALQSKYPGFYQVRDSVLTKEKMYRYNGTTMVELELPVLTEIAWQTTLSTNISSELDFECMYNLESVYNSQRRVQNEINKAADALQKGAIKDLMRILQFLNQLGPQLQDNFSEVKEKLKDCS